MCGITGIMNLDGAPVDKELIWTLTKSLDHRGPDGRGVWTGGMVGLGHTRLAILDPTESSAQPMSLGSDGPVLTYNGEIYNYRELKTELESLGHVFESSGDTEVVLKSYLEWGAECTDRFNGMFAFAIWNPRTQELFLARDRYGVKPLYYAMLGPSFVFGSECRAIQSHPEGRNGMNLECVLEYFTFQNIFSDKTFFHGINLFPAGHRATIRMADGKFDLVQYWDFDFWCQEDPLRWEESLEELDYLFNQAVKRQMVSDVEVGVYLSGGIDSGAITSVASGVVPNLKSFTCGFDLSSASGQELHYDERRKSELMSYTFNTEHYEMVLKAGDMERALPHVASALEEPRMGQCYPNYYAAGLASRFVKVVLAGTGGDELFAGYPWRYFQASRFENFEQYVDEYYLYWQRLIPNKSLQAVFAPVWDAVKHVWTRDIFRNVFRNRRPPQTWEDYINNSLYFEAKTFLHGLLILEDKLSMAHGLETRVPFLDNDLVDFAMRTPVIHKLGNLTQTDRIDENALRKKTKYFEPAKDGKLVLRSMLSSHLPPAISNGRKQGFSGPDGSWFRDESLDLVKKTLLNGGSDIYNIFDKKAVEALVHEHLDGKKNRRLLIWSLLNFDTLLKIHSGEAGNA